MSIGLQLKSGWVLQTIYSGKIRFTNASTIILPNAIADRVAEQRTKAGIYSSSRHSANPNIPTLRSPTTETDHARSAQYLHLKEWQLRNVKTATVGLVQHRFNFLFSGRNESLLAEALLLGLK